jgi:hypothetical protein
LHIAAINGHSHFSKVFPLSITECNLLADKNLHIVAQLLEVNDLTGRLTRVVFLRIFEKPHNLPLVHATFCGHCIYKKNFQSNISSKKQGHK